MRGVFVDRTMSSSNVVAQTVVPPLKASLIDQLRDGRVGPQLSGRQNNSHLQDEVPQGLQYIPDRLLIGNLLVDLNVYVRVSDYEGLVLCTGRRPGAGRRYAAGGLFVTRPSPSLPAV
jgi:hypothetical protein